jgi:hypothetical protein
MVRSFRLRQNANGQLELTKTQILAKEFNRSLFARDSGKHVILLHITRMTS